MLCCYTWLPQTFPPSWKGFKLLQGNCQLSHSRRKPTIYVILVLGANRPGSCQESELLSMLSFLSNMNHVKVTLLFKQRISHWINAENVTVLHVELSSYPHFNGFISLSSPVWLRAEQAIASQVLAFAFKYHLCHVSVISEGNGKIMLKKS